MNRSIARLRPPYPTAPSQGVVVLVSLAFSAFSYAGVHAQAQAASDADTAPEVRDLRAVFEPGYLLEDRNGDSVIDFIGGSIIVPGTPSDAEVVAAANIAARLGYETSAADLGLLSPLATTHDRPVILIGRSASPELGIATPASLGELAPGQGSVSWIPPDSRFLAGAVLIDGYDATGMLAAAEYFAGRYPAVWAIDGANLADVAGALEAFVEERGFAAATAAIDHVVVDANRAGMSRLIASIEVADEAAVDRLADALTPPPPAATESGGRGGRGGAAGGRGGRAGGAGAAGGRAGGAGQGAGAGRGGRGGQGNQQTQPQDLPVTDLHRLDVHVRAAGTPAARTVRILPPRPWPARNPSAFQYRDSPDFPLSALFTNEGLYRDSNQDMIPDRIEGYLSVSGTEAATGLVDFATRVGLEGAGLRIPLVELGGQSDRPADLGFPILYGTHHYITDQLRERDALGIGEIGARTGFAELVGEAADGRSALVVSGADDAGLEAIADYLSGRAPYLWEYGKGNYRLSEVDDEVRRFFQGGGGAGQAALATQKLRTWLGRVRAEHGDALDSISVEFSAREAAPGLDDYLQDVVAQTFPNVRTRSVARNTAFGIGETIFEQDFDIPWEVDDAMALVDGALAQLGASGSITVRVSESPEQRARIRDDINAKLRGRGIDPAAYDVQVLSAYKQGYSWLYDDVLPRLRGQGVARIEIDYHTLRDSDEVRWQTIAAATRWLQELYPVDAALARELEIPDSLITFHPRQQEQPIYAVRAFDASGREVLRDEFDPKYIVRPFFDLFPEYEQVRVTTGWVEIVSDGRTLVDERVSTDPERFWDVLQSETYGRIIDYVMDVQDGRPSGGNAPFFDEFRVELSMSEPNYRLGVDEEVISSLEALHEDIYFETLTLFDLIGNRYGVGSLDYSGRVLPYIQPPRDGQAGHAHITFTGKDGALEELVFTYTPRGQEPDRERYNLGSLPTAAPVLRGLAVNADGAGIERLLYDVVASDSVDRYEEFRARSSEQSIDRTFLSVPMLEGMTTALSEMHERGLYGDAMSFDRVAEFRFRFKLDDDSASFERFANVARSPDPLATERPTPPANGWRWNGEQIVQWETPIAPAESDELMGKLNTFDNVNVYWVGESFLGQDIYAADFLPPQDARYVSQAKLNALKPTLLLSGRQHANEVSSTSHILRLGELIATDSAYREMLNRVNVVLHPITNPDGARLAYEMQLENPDFMLHAGYLGALGVDATSGGGGGGGGRGGRGGGGGGDPIYPESRVRPELRETWLPDIYMNLHGYPSHEWVQYFAGYSAWVRSRNGGQRDWWAPRGWFVPGFSWVDDDRYPEIKEAQFAILDSVAAAITGEPEVDAMNRRLYARYRKYGQQDVDDFREYFHNGILVYQSLEGSTVGGGASVNSPRITYFSATTEAPDETARGDWLDLVATAGLAHTSALLRYLATGTNEIVREDSETDTFITRMVYRNRPVLPRPAGTPVSNDEASTSGGEQGSSAVGTRAPGDNRPPRAGGPPGRVR